MKANNQKNDKKDGGVSRDTLNAWQRKDAAKNAKDAKHREADPKDAQASRRLIVPQRLTFVCRCRLMVASK
jgi:hypothetical protein